MDTEISFITYYKDNTHVCKTEIPELIRNFVEGILIRPEFTGTDWKGLTMSQEKENNQDTEFFEKKISIAVSGVAVMLLLNSMGAGNASSEAAFQNTVAINTYAFYQAKTTRQNDLELAATTIETVINTAVPAINAGAKQYAKDVAAGYREKAKSYDTDPNTGEGKKELLTKARAAEALRDAAMSRGPYFDFASLFLQLAVILFSIVLITKKRTLLLTAAGTALVGGLSTANAFFMFVRVPGIG